MFHRGQGESEVGFVPKGEMVKLAELKKRLELGESLTSRDLIRLERHLKKLARGKAYYTPPHENLWLASKEVKARIFSRDSHKCVACGNMKNLAVDHAIPRGMGGSEEDCNLQTLCKSCNSLKNNHPWAGPTIRHFYEHFPEPLVKDVLWLAFQKRIKTT